MSIQGKSLSLEKLWKPPCLRKQMGKPLVLLQSLIYSAHGLVILVWNRFGAFCSALVCLSRLALHSLMNYTSRVGRGSSGKELLAPRNEALVLKGVMEPVSSTPVAVVCPHGVPSRGGGCAQQNQLLSRVTDTVRGVK